LKSEAQAVRIVPCFLVLAVVLAGTSGCQLFGKKGGDVALNGAPPAGDKTKISAPTDPLTASGPARPDLDTLITGQVIDVVGRPADARIRWVSLDETKEVEAPIEVTVNEQGYFTIQGLKSGKHYKLIVRAKSGEKLLEKVVYTSAPNTNLLIRMEDRFAVPDKGTRDKDKKSAGKSAEQPASAQVPGYPGKEWQAPPTTQLPRGADITRIADGPVPVAKAPTVKINPGPSQDSTGAGSPLTIPIGPAPVPSCVRIGKRIENFALNDISLTPWELKTNRRGKLVLLDFWKTTCPPCLQSIATLRVLQDKYCAQGFDVVAIAYEDSGTPMDQAVKVTKVAAYYQTNYLLLLGGGDRCPLYRDAEVRAFPTMVLLDEVGNIVWRHEGALDRDSINDLEFAIKRRLN
jgi:thiol-disulfide isomerase/thioredoxin